MARRSALPSGSAAGAEDDYMNRPADWSLAGRHRRFARFALALALLLGFFVQSISPAVPSASAVTRAIKLPVPSGTQMTVSQGYNTDPNAGGSHYSCVDYPALGCSATWAYKYSVDLRRVDGTTEGTTVVSPVNGTIRWIDEAYGGMSIDLGNGYAVAYFHTVIAPGLEAGDTVTQGQYMGTIAPPGQGGNGGFPHIHVTVWQTTDGGNWNRTAIPFTGTYALDGTDMPNTGAANRNQWKGTTLTSTNAASGSTTVPRQVAKTGPAHNASVTTSTVNLSWSPATGATSYQVSIDGGSVLSSWITTTSWTTPALASGSHTWIVTAKNNVGTGSVSSTWRFTIVTSAATTTLDNGGKISTGKYRIKATRQGMVGGTTSSGHVIIENDNFVSLPACVTTTCSWLTPGTTSTTYGYVTSCGSKCYVMIYNPTTKKCVVSPVLDRGPLTNVDDFWNATSSRYVNQKIEDKGLSYQLAQGYPADAAALDGYDVGWGKSGNVGRTYFAGGTLYTPTFPTSMDVGDGAWLGLGFPWNPGPQTVEVTMLWQVSTTVADAQATCGAPTVPYFTMSKSSGTPQSVITVNGKNFNPGEKVNIYLDSSANTPLATVTTDSRGRYTTTFKVPNTAGGPHKIIAVGQTSSKRVTKDFFILPRSGISTISGSANLTITVKGYNFASGEKVNLTWDNGTTVVASGTASASGNINFTVRAPSVGGTHTAKMTGVTYGKSATVQYTTVQRVRTTETSGSSSNTVTVYGTGWPTNVTVTFRWQSATGSVLCSDVTDSTGYASCTFKPYSSAENGPYKIYGTYGSKTASTTFTVVGFASSDDETPTATPSPTATETVSDASPIASPESTETPAPEETSTEVAPTETVPVEETASPVETPTAEPTVAPEPVISTFNAVADTSVAWATPDAAQPVEALGSLTVGGENGSVTYVGFDVSGIGSGTVTSAQLVLTATGDGGTGGALGAISGYIVDENGTAQSLPADGIAAAFGSDGNPAIVGSGAPGQQIVIDVTLSVQVDGQYTFVLAGADGAQLQISSREGSAPPQLIITTQP